jgi:hypothetical protein
MTSYDITRISGMVNRVARVKALDRGSDATRGLDSSRTSAMLCLSGGCHPYL